MKKRLKKSIAFLLSITMIMTMLLNGTFVMTASAETITPSAPMGDGTANNPYQIGTAGELYWLLKPSTAEKPLSVLSLRLILS